MQKLITTSNEIDRNICVCVYMVIKTSVGIVTLKGDDSRTRGCHKSYQRTTTNVYRISFFPKIILDWNICYQQPRSQKQITRCLPLCRSHIIDRGCHIFIVLIVNSGNFNCKKLYWYEICDSHHALYRIAEMF